MKNSLVTVIVPVFNTSQYLDRCIKSLIEQTYKNIEIILIDDHSTDDSLQICKKYANEDNRIIIIENEVNKGVSISRNNGIERANGEYIMFLDSDDYVTNSYIEDIIDDADVDLRIFGFSYLRNGEISNQKLPCDAGDYEMAKILSDNIPLLLNLNILHLSTNKMFKTKIIKESNIRFNGNLKSGEDLKFVIDYVSFVKNFRVYQCYNYIYNRDNMESATRKGIYKLPVTINTNNSNINNFLLKQGCDLDFFNSFCMSMFLYGLNTILKNVGLSFLQKYRLVKEHFKLNCVKKNLKRLYSNSSKQDRTIELIRKKRIASLILKYGSLDFNIEVSNEKC